VIYIFQGGTDGSSPVGSLMPDRSGNLFGTTSFGGSAIEGGTVFELTPGSNGQWTETLPWAFTGGQDGESPVHGVAVGPAGQLYAAAVRGGTFSNGTVIGLTADGGGGWNETTITSFPYADGGVPRARLIADGAGNFYGTTSIGGAHGSGMVFKLTPSGGTWEETILYNFPTGLNPQQGATPSSLVFDASGNLDGEPHMEGHIIRAPCLSCHPRQSAAGSKRISTSSREPRMAAGPPAA
jgi:uncharacterized repeat protein (TIGR03803 family)